MTTVARWRVYPRLGRVSNLPTIATQTAAAVAIAESRARAADVALLGAGFAAAYVAGMFLNDAFDRAIDARQRPDRPIPAGLIAPREVFGAGAALLAIGVVLIALAGVRRGHGLFALSGGVALAAAIVTYDAWHKGNPVAPVVMGICRGLVYVGAALALDGRISALVVAAGVAMILYVTGLTEVARAARTPLRGALMLGATPLVLVLALAGRSPWPLVIASALAVTIVVALRTARAGDRERATVLLLSGMSLVDATLLAGEGYLIAALLAAVALPVTRALQAVVRGT